MADSVVRNATKEDDPDIGYDEIVRLSLIHISEPTRR